jgi:hypothetical protein
MTDLSNKLPGESVVEYYKRVRFVLETRIKDLTRQLQYQATRSAARGPCEKCNTKTNWIVMTGDRGAYWCGCE